MSIVLAGTDNMPQRHMTRHVLHAASLAGHLHLGSQTTEATVRPVLTADMKLILMSPAALTQDRLIVCHQRMKAWMKGSCVLSAGLVLVCNASMKLALYSHGLHNPCCNVYINLHYAHVLVGCICLSELKVV